MIFFTDFEKKPSSRPIKTKKNKIAFRERINSLLEYLTLIKNLFLILIYLITCIIILVLFAAIFHSEQIINPFSVTTCSDPFNV